MCTKIPDLIVACSSVVSKIRHLMSNSPTPILVALDGGSGSGKSTLALLIEKELHVALIRSDDFFSADIPDAKWDTFSIEERARLVINWQRLRHQALEPLLAGRAAKWHTFDFEAGLRPDGTYGICIASIERNPAPVILLEGAYSTQPELSDLITLSVLVDVPLDIRHERLVAREEAAFLRAWHERWDAVEAYYFSSVRPRSSFDLVVCNNTNQKKS